MARDMTQGGIVKTLLLFSIPLILSGILQQMYSWSDALIVGNFINEGALASVSATSIISTNFTAMLFGLSTGVSILVSRAFGTSDVDTINKATSTFTVTIVAIALVFAAIGFIFAVPLLELLSTPADMLDSASEYLQIIFIGVPFMAVYNIYGAILRGIGDSRTPMLSIVVSTVTNIALDFLFVAAFGWGVAGTAWSTVIAQALMAVFIAAYSTHKYQMMRFKLGAGWVDMRVLKDGMKLGLPTALQSGVRSIGGMVLQSIMNSFGIQVVAAVTTAYRIDSVALLPVLNLGAGMTNFVAQNDGAGNAARARKGLKAGWILSGGMAAAIIVIILPTCGFMMGMFGIGPETIQIGQQVLFTLAMAYPMFGVLCALLGYFQGMGDVMFAGAANIGALALRIALSYMLAPMLGWSVIAWSELISWAVLLAVCLLRYWQKYSKRALTVLIPAVDK